MTLNLKFLEWICLRRFWIDDNLAVFNDLAAGLDLVLKYLAKRRIQKNPKKEGVVFLFSSSVCLCEEDTKRTLQQFALHIWQGRSLLALVFRLFFLNLRLSSFEFFIVFYDKPLSNRPYGSSNLSTRETCLRRRVQILP